MAQLGQGLCVLNLLFGKMIPKEIIVKSSRELKA